MSANSAVQHLASGLGASVGGKIIVTGRRTAIARRFGWVGIMAMAATLLTLWLAGRVRSGGVALARQSEPSCRPNATLDRLTRSDLPCGNGR